MAPSGRVTAELSIAVQMRPVAANLSVSLLDSQFASLAFPHLLLTVAQFLFERIWLGIRQALGTWDPEVPTPLSTAEHVSFAFLSLTRNSTTVILMGVSTFW